MNKFVTFNMNRGKAMAFAPVARGENKLSIRNEADCVTIDMIGAVGSSWYDEGGITEKEFRNALKSIPAGKRITLNVNSEGGSVQEGLGIYNAIKERSADITAKYSGYALSIASVFPLAASRRIASKASLGMIHCAWSWAQGNAEDMRKQAEMLDKHDDTLCGIYANVTGKSKSVIKADMQAETWMSGAEMLAYGLATKLEEEDAQASFRELPQRYLDRCKNLSPQTLAAVKRDKQPSNAGNPGNDSGSVSAPQPNQPGMTAAKISAPTQGSAKQKNQQPQDTTVNKEQKIAMLKTWGVNVQDSVTDAELDALIAKGKPQAAPANDDALAKVQAQLATERKARITAEVTRRAENKIKNEQLETVIAMAMQDENKAYSFIDSLPEAHIGSEPLGSGGIELGNAPVLAGWGERPTPKIENIFKTHGTQAERYAAIKANYSDILAEAARKDGCKPGIYNANTFSATLTTSFLILGATTQAGNKFAPIRLFCRDASVDPYKPLATGVMKFTTGTQDGSDVQTNAANFESTEGTINPISVTVSQYTVSQSVTNSDLNSGIRMEDLALAKLRSLGSKVIQVLTAPITVANYATLDGVTAAPETFGFSELTALQGQLKKANTRNLILDGEYLARLMNVPSFFQVAKQGLDGVWSNAFGWDNIALSTVWSGAGTNVRGFACDPQAIGSISGLPLVNNAGIPGGILSVSTGVIPGADLPIAVYMWFNTSTRSYWFSYDTMFGASKMDTSVGAIVKSA